MAEEQEEIEVLKQALPKLSFAECSRVQQKLLMLDRLWLPFIPEIPAMDPAVLRVKALRTIEALAARIEKEKGWAVEEFARLLINAIKVFNEHRAKEPRLFLQVMETHTSWPVLASSHPLFMEEWKMVSGRLGKRTGLKIGNSARWNPQDTGTKVALKLLQFIIDRRSKAKAHLEKQAADRDDIDPLSSPLVDMLASLPELSKKNGAVWWDAAEVILLNSYPEIQNVPIFSDMVKAKSHRKYPSQIRERILANIKGKFLNILANSPTITATGSK